MTRRMTHAHKLRPDKERAKYVASRACPNDHCEFPVADAIEGSDLKCICPQSFSLHWLDAALAACSPTDAIDPDWLLGTDQAADRPSASPFESPRSPGYSPAS